LIHAAVDGGAALRAQVRIPGEAQAGAERLVERGLLDSEAIGGVQPRGAQRGITFSREIREPRARDHPRAEIRVVLGADAGGGGEALAELVARLDVAGLVVASRVAANVAQPAVLHFVG